MRTINLIVVHCSATQGNRMLSPEALDLMHRRRGFNGTGYHYYIRKDGTVHLTRPVERIGAHVKGFRLSIPIYVFKYIFSQLTLNTALPHLKSIRRYIHQFYNNSV